MRKGKKHTDFLLTLQTAQRGKSQASQYLRHLDEVAQIDQVHSFIGTIKEFLKTYLDTSLRQTSPYYVMIRVLCHVGQHTLFIKKKEKSDDYFCLCLSFCTELQ